jgi:adenylate cyclase
LSLATTIAGRITGRLQPEALPERVQKLIRAREEESERLIGWVQLGLVVTLGALFFIAPRPTDAGMPLFDPVPIALTAYAIFTIARLLLAYRRRLPWWLLVISILIDTALLMTLIWSFHAQYDQPAAFSLKVPTFIYGFVFIALRGLRFDYRYVLLTGASFALGWAAMVWVAIRVDGVASITRNFKSYLKGNYILIGAEFDKIVTVLLVTGLLALAVRRAQAMLVLATSEQAAGQEIRRFLSGGVADAITKSDELIEAGVAVEREAAIVMLDLRGFTKLAATMPPQQMVEILTGFHARVVPLIQRHGGVIDKFLGDGVMATFGAVKASQSAAADALRALDAVMGEAARWSGELARTAGAPVLAVNGAAAAGTVVFATLGSTERLEFTVIGDAVNLAAKLEKHNKVTGSRALVSAATLATAVRQGYVPPPAARAIPGSVIAGLGEPLDVVALR